MKKVFLYIEDCGDTSVGIFPQTFTVECPFTEDEVKNGIVDKESLEFFREKAIALFGEFSEFCVSGIYSFEDDSDPE